MGCVLTKNLSHIDPDDIEYFSFDGLTINAKPCNIYDGDTFSILFMFNNKLPTYIFIIAAILDAILIILVFIIKIKE